MTRWRGGPVTVTLVCAITLAGCIGAPVWEDPGEADFTITDPAGDTAWGGGTDPYKGAGAAAMDALAVRVVNGATDLEVHLELRDVEAHSEHIAAPDFHAQYAVSFRVNGESPGFSTRADISGPDRGGGQDGRWRFQLHDKETDEWPDATATMVGSTIKWMVPLDWLGATAGDSLTDWAVQTWASTDTRDQYGDRMHGTERFEIGS